MLTTPTPVDRYILLVFDGLYVFVPQITVQSVEIIADLYVHQTSAGAVGWFEQEHGQGQQVPIFCLDYNLTLIVTIPRSRQYLVIFHHPQSPLGVISDTVEIVDLMKENINPQQLPPIMTTAETPITHLLVYQNQIGCLCKGETFTHYLNHQSERFSQNQVLPKPPVRPRLVKER
ncbi:MAG: hypothetical protein SVR94_16865 [Pseudomonadota bacterium]|nr:hypothetical protein [Pseudomonadota bacterium]